MVNHVVLIVLLAVGLAALSQWSVLWLTISISLDPVSILEVPLFSQPQTQTLTLKAEPAWGNPDSILSRAIPLLKGHLQGPETVFAGRDGRSLFFLEQNAGQIKWAPGGDLGACEVYAKVGGCPLGGGMDSAGNVIYCDCSKGLLMVEADTRHVRFLTDQVSEDSPLDAGSHIGFADDLDIAQDGTIYFSDATEMSAHYLESTRQYNAMQVAHFSSLQGATGRLLSYNPSTKKTHVLAKGLYFANGVALSADEDFIVVAATYSTRLYRYWLRGPQAGQLEKFVDLIGAPDGVSRGSNGTFWVAIPSPVPDNFVAATGNKYMRYVFSMLPLSVVPKPIKVGLVAQISSEGKVLRYLQDSEGGTVHLLTSVNEINNKLYLGNLHDTCAHTLEL